jgi:radical SAM superfamily enzyme YgiQ (UPF0313 family)
VILASTCELPNEHHRLRQRSTLTVYLVNPSDKSFGIGVITPRWLYVLAAATPSCFGDPLIVDETLEQLDITSISAGDVVGIGIHTGNALRGYEIGRLARQQGAFVVFGGVHATLFPNEAHQLGCAHAVVKGDGDIVWADVLRDCKHGSPKSVYAAGRIEASAFQSARWDLLPRKRYMWASVQTVRGCPKHCSFCSVWRTDGQRPRIRSAEAVVRELQQLRRLGFRFVLLADDNFYPVSLTDLKLASRQGNTQRLHELNAIRAERFELMERLAADVPPDMVFFTQITMEAAEDPAFLDAMSRAKIKGALVGVEAVTPQGLKDIYKDFNAAGEELVNRLRCFPQHGVKVLGSFIFGLPSDLPETFETTLSVAQRADLAFAQFVMLMPFPGTVDFEHWEKTMQQDPTRIAGIPLTRHWLIPRALRPKVFSPHPVMSAEEIRQRTQQVWDRFYTFRSIWRRAHCVTSLKSRLAFLLISKLYRQMYANTGIAIDSARLTRSVRWARWMAKPCRMLFSARPLPDA